MRNGVNIMEIDQQTARHQNARWSFHLFLNPVFIVKRRKFTADLFLEMFLKRFKKSPV